MPQVGFEPTISAGERPQTYALDGAATGTGIKIAVTRFVGKGAYKLDILKFSRNKHIAI